VTDCLRRLSPFLLGFLLPLAALSQIDPVKRELIQVGYNGYFEGHAPLAAYGFFYRNQPNFLETNLTLRLAVAPVYLDSELGISHALGENTDLGIGLAGGGFADSYSEIDQGTYIPEESFNGNSGETSLSIYHLFDPGRLIPLNGYLRGTYHYSAFAANDTTAPNFQVPPNFGIFEVRTGLRWGGREPLLYPALAMELSVWYQGEFRTSAPSYGFNDNLHISPQTHLFWLEAYLAYTLPKSKHYFSLGLTAGTSLNADRLSAYRLGGLLPLVSEFPLSLPGYYYQELSAEQFVLIGGNYIVPVSKNQHWNLDVTASTAYVDYLDGLSQPGFWNSGVGGGILYKSSSLKMMVGYQYGIDAIRSHGRGANSVGVWFQFDLEHAKGYFKESEPGDWRGFQRMFQLFSD
jgi:hypothetical protein